ncbi:MAG TPA: hypothetical protein VNT26_10795 [Candidatus Sulfotelmatobacter sp.]|nr:hypothetical protein [Candidatus Sulfotelmatobacter sp.]
MKTLGQVLRLPPSILLLLVLVPGCRHAPTAAASSAALQAGAAEVDITPPTGYRMAGYFDERLATGVHDPLKAKALVLQQGSTQLAWVFCDLLGLPLEVSAKARAAASRQTGIPVSHIVISATHSHTGPLLDDVRERYSHDLAMAKYGADPHRPIDYPVSLSSQLAKVIAAAQASLRPAQLAAGMVKQPDLTFNRRFWMKDGKVVFNPGQLNPNIVQPAGPSDPDVGMLLIQDPATRQPLAGATIFAMHSDTIGGTEYSADYEYYLEKTLRRGFGSRYLSAFAAGTCGDLNHINVHKKEVAKGAEVSERLGSTLGQTVLAAAPQLPLLTQPTLAARSTTVRVPLQTVTAQDLADARSKIDKLGDAQTDFFTKVIAVKRLDLATRGATWPMEVQVFRLDAQTAIVCLPGEIFVELGLAIKQASPFKNTLVMSICNDRPSYVPTIKAFSEGSYEVINSRVQAGVGEQLVAAASKLLDQLHPLGQTKP